MNLDDVLRKPHAWTADPGSPAIAVSSRVRLARNLEGHSFPDWAGEDECVRIWQALLPELRALKTMAPSVASANEDMPDLDRMILVERHWVSREHARKGRGSGFVLSGDEAVSLMVNEEDHLRMQALSSGLRLQEAWKRIDAVDSELEQRVAYAFSPRLGYLTACPSNVGTGIRASVMLHLPALAMLDEMTAVTHGIQKLGLTVRGLWGEGTEAAGDFYQVSNQMTLGEREERIVAGLEQIVRELIGHETNARERLRRTREALLFDRIGRALGVLSHAHILTSGEALAHLSALRLGIETGIVKAIDRATVDELLLMTQPAHIQRLEGRTLNPAERDEARARWVRMRLGASRPARRNRKRNE